MRSIAFWVVTLSLAACVRERPAPTARGGGPSVVAAAPSAWQTKTEMMAHFAASDIMLSALLRGDLEAYRSAAAILAAEGRQGPAFSRSTALRDAANLAREAATIRDAAFAAAAIGATCGNCHRTEGGPSDSIGSPPTSVEKGSLRMARHRWAADRMWQGLIEPADDAWYAGAQVFADAPLVFDAVPGSAPQEQQVAAFTLAARAHAVAEEARSAVTTGERVRLFGELYTTCAGCHAVVASK